MPSWKTGKSEEDNHPQISQIYTDYGKDASRKRICDNLRNLRTL